MQNVLIFIYIGIVEPFNKRGHNRNELVNEFMIVMITDVLFIFTDFCPDLELKYNVGWAYIFVMVMCICFNGYFILKGIYNSLYLLFKYLNGEKKVTVVPVG